MKKIYTSFLLLIFMISLFTFTKEAISKPEVKSNSLLNISSYNVNTDSNNVNKSDKIKIVNDSINSQINEGNNVLLFCKMNNNDCIFLMNNVIPSLKLKYKLDDINIKLVDVEFLGEDFSNATLKREWNLESFPTFQLINNHEGKNNYIESLTFNKQGAVTLKNVENWLLDINHLQPLTIEVKGEAIEKPLE